MMSKSKFLNLFFALALCLWSACPHALAQNDTSNDPTFSRHYIAQDSDEQSYSDEGGGEESGDEQASSGSSNADFGVSDGRVSLATVFVNALGMVLLIVFILAIPVSGSFLVCGAVWKIGMVMRGGKKPDIG